MNDISKTILQDWKIVVVDDEPDSLAVAEIMLLEYGADVYTAADGKEGVQLIRTIRPRFVISDLSMPVMDGWGLIAEVKNDRTLMDIPVIALTAHAMTGDREKALAAGFHNYLTKPLTAGTFMHNLLGLLVDIPEFSEMLALN